MIFDNRIGNHAIKLALTTILPGTDTTANVRVEIFKMFSRIPHLQVCFTDPDEVERISEAFKHCAEQLRELSSSPPQPIDPMQF